MAYVSPDGTVWGVSSIDGTHITWVRWNVGDSEYPANAKDLIHDIRIPKEMDTEHRVREVLQSLRDYKWMFVDPMTPKASYHRTTVCMSMPIKGGVISDDGQTG